MFGWSRRGAGVLLTALICAVLAVNGLDSTVSAQTVIDYDADDDGLIEVTSEAQLNAIRWDLDGNGVVEVATNATTYAAAFPTPATGMGCPATGCAGYELAEDISLTSTGVGWAPIGDGTADDPPFFIGTFDGNGHTISNLFINRTTDNVGLFGLGFYEAVIRNVKLTDVNVTGGNNVGALFGNNFFTFFGGGAQIENCEVTGTVTGLSRVGGLAGKNGGSITGSSADVDVTASIIDAAAYAGGLVGENLAAPIRNSHASGDVTASHNYVGGLVGRNLDELAVTSATDPRNAISGSTASGTVTTTGNFVGGLVGWNNGPISDSAALNPSVTGVNSVGGLVGTNVDDEDRHNRIDRSIATANVMGTGAANGTGQHVGGLVGVSYGPIRDSYASGAVRGNHQVGGLVGHNTAGVHSSGGRVFDSRADGDVGAGNAAVAADRMGGLVGYSDGRIVGGVATGAVTGSAASSALGGLVGQNAGSINDSAATGAVSGGQTVGGLVGYVATTGTVTESWTSGAVTAIALASAPQSGTNVGGLVGWSDGTVGASFATGDVTGVGSAGGLLGLNTGAVIATYATGSVTVSDNASCSGLSCPRVAGGLIGLARKQLSPDSTGSSVRASYSTGSVIGPSGHVVGGLAGKAGRETPPSYSASFTDSYWDTETSGSGPTFGVGSDDEDDNGFIEGTETLTAGVTGQTTAALKAPTGYTGIFANWDVTVPQGTTRTGGPWDFGGVTDYPVLRGVGAAPVFPGGTATRSVVEDLAAGIPIGLPVRAVGGHGDALSYKLVGADAVFFSIESTTGQLLTKTILDYENPVDADRDNEYEFMVQAADGVTTAFQPVVVSVTDLSPTITGSETVTVAENSTAVATYAAQDPDGLASTFTWSLGGTDAGAFEISNTGVLTFDPAPNFEEPADTGTANVDNIYEVTVQASDGRDTGELEVLVTVADVDEPPEIIGDASVTIAENSGTFIESYFTSDPEGSITSWETLAGPDERYFAFDNGALSFVDTPDYEARASNVYQVTVGAVDETSNVGELPVTVTITNVNEAPAISGPATIDVDEGHTGTLGTYGTDDPELSLTNWGFIGDNLALSGPDSDFFRFDKETGQLTFAAPPDFEGGGGQYEVTVDANDGELHGMLEVTVNVADVEEPGTLTLFGRQPVVGQPLTATLTEPDGVIGAMTWTWQRSTSASGGGTEIATATSRSYTPVTDDVNHYLTATATYEDGYGLGEMLQAVTEFTTAAANSMNAAPVLPASVDIELPENARPGSNVGSPVQATDTDGDPISYSLSGDSEFVIDQGTGQIKVAPDAVFDFDAGRRNYSVTVTADDGFGASDTVGVTITITNVDEPPVAADDAPLGFDEDTAATIDVLANDSDPEDAKSALTVSVVRGPARGMVVVNDAVDPDEPTITYTPQANYNGADSFSYRVSDPGGLTSNVATVVLTIYPLNDAPEFPPSTAARSVPEDATGDALVGAPVTATDSDPEDTLTYSLSGTDASSFVVDSNGQITVAAGVTFDIGTKPTYTVTVTATDSATPPLTATVDVTITVTTGPVIPPNNAPTFASPAAARSVPEDATGGALVGARVTATDIDAGDILTYRLSGTDATSFVVDSNGQITVAAGVTFDIGTKPTYTVTVTATDSATPPLTATVDVTITVTTGPVIPPNNAPTFASLTAARSVPEDATGGALVGARVTATDIDAGDILTYRLSGTDATSFVVDSNGQITVAAGVTFDIGTKPTYTVTVTATDSATPPLTATVDVTITVTTGPVIPPNNAPTFASPAAARSVPEDATGGALVGALVTATDIDAGDTLTYSLSGTDATSFVVDSNGQITVAAGVTFNMAMKPTYTVTVTAADEAGATASIAVTITVTTGPVIPPNNAPTFASLTAARSVPEDATGGALVGALVTATDIDAGDILTYRLSGADASSFVIDSNGQITVAAGVTFNMAMKPTYTVTVTAADEAGATASIAVTITVTTGPVIPPINEPPVAADDAPLGFDEDTAATIDVLANDSDPEDAKSELTVSVVGGPARGAVVVNDPVDPDGPTITYTPQANYNGADSFSYQVTDSGGLTSNVAMVVLTIYALNDAPEFPATTTTAHSGHSVSEEAQYAQETPSERRSRQWTSTATTSPTAWSVQAASRCWTAPPRSPYARALSWTPRTSPPR